MSNSPRRTLLGGPPAITNSLGVVTASRWMVFLCWFTVVFEGYDIVALGAAIPTLTEHAGMDVAALNVVVTLSLVGVGVGAAAMGPISDRFGRRWPLIIAALSFSIFTLLLPLFPNPAAMAVLRLLAGLGLGGCMPVALAMMQEAAPPERRSRANGLVMTGYHVGAVAASLVALWVGASWELLFYVGGALGVILSVVMFFQLPETAFHKVAAAEVVAAAGAKPGVLDTLKPRYLRATIGLWVANFMGLVLIYGLNSWLPKVMTAAGYPVANSLVMLFIFNVGAIAGIIISGRLADAKGIKGVALAWFAAATVLLLIMAIRMDNEYVLNGVIFISGVFVFSTSVLLYAMAGYIYEKRLVGTGIGLTSGIGRFGAIIGPYIFGLMIAAGSGYPGVFFVCAGAAVIGLLVVLQIPVARVADHRKDAETVA
ncbi:MFS transporter [Microbacterium sediminis]|uniref:MFS transporter n=1 Tax=Microbacterium sediminis TaxID=904291 RepID=A0A1B9N9T0_9MICO|nr:aromatic acid/H+ symport family MFS transporter [Microbacterium sediminis]OCG73294.1 MFS transporter [Microbacterium sediminis]QBR75185.1 MFS transporter [Microbacterium sediminis]